jgi:fructose-bisphosphate aldolase, class I
MDLAAMTEAARTLVGPGRGILAADESFGTIERRFTKVGITSTQENRRAYREMLFTAPGIANYISGVILFDETIRQNSADGAPLRDLLTDQGVIPGIKVDAGAKALAGSPGETVTEGLDGLRDRLSGYRDLGARFAKWRAVITIGPGLPTTAALSANAHALARYAALCQEAGLVPIVEPEVLMKGDHNLDRSYEVTLATLTAVFAALAEQHVALEAMLLKSSMVLAGSENTQSTAAAEVATATLRCLRNAVPPAVAGIVFLSGGQEEMRATANLNAIVQLDSAAWPLSFSYGRALQDTALATWAGKQARAVEGQAAFIHRARANAAAVSGNYNPQMERSA